MSCDGSSWRSAYWPGFWRSACVWIFSESGGALTFIAAGVFATVAILALVGERIIKTLEEIRDGSVTRIRVNAPAERLTERVVTEREVEQLAASR